MSMSAVRFADLPEGVSSLLPAALRNARTVFRRYDFDATMLTVDWSEEFHHSVMPAVVALDTLVDTTAAELAHANVRLLDMLGKITAMDEYELQLLGAVGGVRDAGRNAVVFARHLRAIVARPVLQVFFDVDAQRSDHYGVRPIDGLRAPKGRTGLPELDRFLLVTVVALYNANLARAIFKRDWNPPAVEAFAFMNSVRHANVPSIQAACADWYGLIAKYPGW